MSVSSTRFGFVADMRALAASARSINCCKGVRSGASPVLAGSVALETEIVLLIGFHRPAAHAELRVAFPALAASHPRLA